VSDSSKIPAEAWACGFWRAWLLMKRRGETRVAVEEPSALSALILKRGTVKERTARPPTKKADGAQERSVSSNTVSV
jgi:hypothetical protein